jgi:hypothetical protein
MSERGDFSIAIEKDRHRTNPRNNTTFPKIAPLRRSTVVASKPHRALFLVWKKGVFQFRLAGEFNDIHTVEPNSVWKGFKFRVQTQVELQHTL